MTNIQSSGPDSAKKDLADTPNEKSEVTNTLENNNVTSNLKKNMSLVFQKTTAVEGLAVKDKDKDKDNPLVPDSTTTKERFSPLLRQSVTAAGSIIATLSAGMTSGYSATLLPQLAQPDSPILLTQDTSSWIASMAPLPMFLGCILSGLIMEPCGRRLTHQLLAVPFVLGWVLIATAPSLMQLLAGRFITGLCVGLLGPVGSIYIGEISDPKYRGLLLAGISLAISAGLLLVHVIGTFCHWQLTAAVCSVVPFISYLILSFVPESPSWLASKGKTEKAVKSFKWLRGCDEKSMEELEAFLRKQAEMAMDTQTRLEVPFFSVQKLRNFKATFRRPEFVKPLFIMIVFFFTLQLSGVNAIAFYSVSIMRSTLGSGFNEYLAMLIIDVIRLLVSMVACVLLRIIGRRPLTLISASFTIVSLLGLSIYKFVIANTGHPEISWIPLLFFIGYIVATTIGLTALPWVMTGEVFPVDLRGMGSGICTSMCFIAFFLVVKTAPAMFEDIGMHGSFLTYAVFVTIGTVIVYFYLPETKGRTLQDIEEAFTHKKNNNNASPKVEPNTDERSPA